MLAYRRERAHSYFALASWVASGAWVRLTQIEEA